MGQRVEYKASQRDIDNFRATMALADETDWADGCKWYGVYAQIIANRASTIGLTIEQATAIFAALSPQCHIDRNVELFEMATDPDFCYWELPVVMDQRHKIHGIFTCPEYAFDFLGGRKVQSFYRNLMGDLSPVTVDAHCASSVKDEKISVVSDRAYEECAQAVIIVAAEYNITPAEAQAVGWLVERKRKRRRPRPARKGQLTLVA